MVQSYDPNVQNEQCCAPTPIFVSCNIFKLDESALLNKAEPLTLSAPFPEATLTSLPSMLDRYNTKTSYQVFFNNENDMSLSASNFNGEGIFGTLDLGIMERYSFSQCEGAPQGVYKLRKSAPPPQWVLNRIRPTNNRF